MIQSGLLTTIPFSHFPIFGNEKSQPIPTSGILFLNQFPKMGTKVSTNFQCGKIKFNQFPVSNGNKIFNQFPVGGKLNSINSQSCLNVKEKDWFKYFNQFLPVGIPVGINSHFGNKLENQIPNLGTNISINSHQWKCQWNSW